jgi:hypothetical protein
MKVSGSRYALVILTAVTLSTVLPLSPAHAQGSLQPPGPPAPTMHSLDQVWYRLDEVNAGISDITNFFYQVNWDALTNLSFDIGVVTATLGRVDWDAIANMANDYALITNALAQINWSAIMNIHTNIAGDLQMLHAKVDRLSTTISNDHANIQLRLALLEANMACTTNMLMQIYDRVNSSP